MQNENDVFKQPLRHGQFLTPQTRLVKPLPTAFLSTGIISKKSRPKPTPKGTPATPAKRLNFHRFLETSPENTSPLQPLNSKTKRTFDTAKDTPTKKHSTTTTTKSPLRYFSFDHPLNSSCTRFITLEYIQSLRLKTLVKDNLIKSTDNYFESHFTILSVLGEGSFARAYKVLSQDKIYTVKASKKRYNGTKDRLQKLEEVEVMWLLSDCSGCVQLINAWEQDGYLYLQMEYCDRGNLEEYIEDATRLIPLSEYEIWRILSELASGLSEIHSRGIIHLDIKPENILVSQDHFKIGDFGLATFYPNPNQLEREGDRTYIAPEVLTSHYGPPADIFRYTPSTHSSLGLILLEIAADIALPPNGEYWQMLRRNDFTAINFGKATPILVEMIKNLLNSDPKKRPTANDILKHPYVASIRSSTPVSTRQDTNTNSTFMQTPRHSHTHSHSHTNTPLTNTTANTNTKTTTTSKFKTPTSSRTISITDNNTTTTPTPMSRISLRSAASHNNNNSTGSDGSGRKKDLDGDTFMA